MNRTVAFVLACASGMALGVLAVASDTDSPAMAVTNAPATGDQAGTNMTVITSTQLRMDTDKKIAYFDGNVLVIDPQFQLRCNRLIVFLNPSGAGMDRAEAFEDVVIVQDTEKRKARSQKAVYTPVDGKMVLTGDPQIENEKGVTRGQIITIFRTNNVILVEGQTRTVLDLSTPTPTNAPPAASSNTPPAEAGSTNTPSKSEGN